MGRGRLRSVLKLSQTTAPEEQFGRTEHIFQKAENTVTRCLMVPFALVPEMTTSTALPKFEDS